jgi:hypothetical protein
MRSAAADCTTNNNSSSIKTTATTLASASAYAPSVACGYDDAQAQFIERFLPNGGTVADGDDPNDEKLAPVRVQRIVTKCASAVK